MSADRHNDISDPSRDAPDSPTELTKRSWIGVLRRAAVEFQEDELGDRAAALTYYSVLSIFPALLALMSILGVLGKSTTDPLINNVESLTPGAARDIVNTALTDLQNNRSGAGILFVVGILAAIWSASQYVAAFMRASNAIYEIEEGRPYVKKTAVRVGVTLVLMLLLAASVIAVVFTGALAKQAGDVLGVGSTAVTVWDIAKWPVLIVVVALICAILYWASPNVKQPGFRWISPGGLVAVFIWMIASVLFGVYVSNFASYNKTYGTFGGVIIFLVWLWISNLAVLRGAEFDAELERARQIEAGHPADKEPFLEPRDTTKMKKTDREHLRS